MKLFKKILPLTALSVSVVMLVLSVIDSLSAELLLFELLPVQLGAVLLLLCSLGVTVLACMERSLRRPLVLLACLFHTPIGGGLLLLYVYDLAFPEQLPMALLLPYIMLLVSVASALQAGVTILCDSIYAAEAVELAQEEAENEAMEEAERKAYASLLDDDVVSAKEKAEASSQETQPAEHKTYVPAEQAPAPASAPTRSAKPAAPVQITQEDEDDLAPIPKKKRGKQPAFETANRTAPPVVPTVMRENEPATKSAEPAAPREKSAATVRTASTDAKTMVIPVVQEKPRYPVKENGGKKQYTDPFGLLTEDPGSDPDSGVKSIFSEDDASH